MTGRGLQTAYAPEPRVVDYWALLKPRVMRLAIFTAAVGMVAAPAGVHPVIAVAAILCIAAGAGAAGALNMWWDADIDARMARTAGRPVASGVVPASEALGIGIALSALSVMLLFLIAGPVAAGLLGFTIFFYAVVYSMWLKRATPQNIVIGGAAGAVPPMIGWAVATGGVAPEAWLMFGLIFLWTPPHFWSLALFRNDDYTAAGVPMLPVVAGERATRNQILIYSLFLAPVAILPALTQIGGPVTLATALVLNARFVRGAVTLWRRDARAAAVDGYAAEKAFFLQSIVYLFAHFVAILIDATLRGAGLGIADWPVLL